ncbi:MAG: DUF3579 domain-containing protein [Sideroxydans sp.]|nr:DUF3579 domain-containing protein [Sideroxydans sp.]
MLSGVSEFVIQGITENGGLFQQEGWAISLCNMLGTVGPDGRMLYSAYARPVMINGVSSVVIRNSLQRVDPKAFEMVKQFVAENQLKVRSGRGSRDAEVTGVHPVIGQERRSLESKGW